jgi:hypothetical protein
MGTNSFANFYARFYPDGAVLSTSAISRFDATGFGPKETAPEVAKWLNPNTLWGQDAKYVCHGTYTVADSQLHFTVKGEKGDIEYDGFVNQADGNLVLGSYSRINGNKSVLIYRFVPLKDLK